MIVITEDSTRAELEEAIGYLRAKRATVEDQQVRDEITAAMDALLDRWKAATS